MASDHVGMRQGTPFQGYWMVELTELEVPTELLIVAEMDEIAWDRTVPVGGVPENVNGTVTVNSPPEAFDAVLSNQAFAASVRGTGTDDVGSVNPDAAVNCTFSVVSVRVVE